MVGKVGNSVAKAHSESTRQAQFLELLRSKPGSSVSELAREMGVQPQQLYAIARRLTASGAIAKRDGGYAVVDATFTSDGSRA
jgi:DNA-binding MarR family transcriptional regulator